jgi:XTP/dITP diphosphohydrolase
MNHEVVLATRNAGKVSEMQAIFKSVGWVLRSQSDFDLPSAPETALTFVENALAKARHVCTATGLPALADDSGLVVDALNGAPGIYSARFAGEGSDDTRNNRRLLEALTDVIDRRAHFYCSLVYLAAADHPEPVIACGRWEGEILHAPRGANGFGYDPLFYVRDLGRSAAELDAREKNRISHRALACQNLLRQLTS